MYPEKAVGRLWNWNFYYSNNDLDNLRKTDIVWSVCQHTGVTVCTLLIQKEIKAVGFAPCCFSF